MGHPVCDESIDDTTRLMGDEDTRTLILAEKDPKEQKRLGRRVSPWDEEKWLESREA